MIILWQATKVDGALALSLGGVSFFFGMVLQ